MTTADPPTEPDGPTLDTTALDTTALDTAAVTAGRSISGASLAPVLHPATTWEVASVDDHRRDARAPRSTGYYSRYGNPTVHEFEDAVAELEGAECALATASGMAAITAVVLGLCSAGDHVVATRQQFSVSSTFFAAHCPRFGIDVTFVDGTDAEAIAAATTARPTQLVYAETPANPALSLVDLAALGSITGPFTVVDSTFAGPVVQRPLEHGVDLVVHAATKGMAGHNDALLGVLAGRRELVEAVWGWHVVAGGQASPFDAWNGIRGLRTLPIRARRQAETALHLARLLEAHPAVARVSYPGLDSHPQRELARRQMATGGTVLAIELAEGLAAATTFVESCRLARLALSLGGPETLLTHPASTMPGLHAAERAELGVSDGLVRISVGLEHADDLAADLRQALDVTPARSAP